MDSVLIISDPGCTHGGNIKAMKMLVHTAKRCGSNCIKFQWTSNARKLAERRNAWEYLASYRLLEFPKEWLFVLANECREVGIEFMTTVYLCEDVAEVDPYVSRFKIASFEANDLEFLAQHIGRKRDILISTGMMDSTALQFYLGRREHWPELKLLHCCSAYPAPLSELNLSAIRKYALDGWSDHSRSSLSGALAVACGAKIIEAHIQLKDSPDGEDTDHSFYPDEFARYVRRIREAEQMCGDGLKRAMPSEWKMEAYRVVNHQVAPSH